MRSLCRRLRAMHRGSRPRHRRGPGCRAALRPGTGPRRERGVALILVVWTFSVLAVLGGEFARAMRDEAMSTRNFKQDTIAHYICIAGLQEGLLAIQAYRATGDLEMQDSDERGFGDAVEALSRGDGAWIDATFNGYDYQLRATGEQGKLPINTVELDHLMFAIENLGYENDVAAVVADSILDWRDEDTEKRLNGAEDDYYDRLEPPYFAKNFQFEAVEELLMVRGVTHEMFYGQAGRPGLKELFTVYSPGRPGQVQLDIYTMTAEMVSVMLNIPLEEARALKQEFRGGVPPLLNEIPASSGLDIGISNSQGQHPSTVTLEARVVDPQTEHTLSQVGIVVNIGSQGSNFRLYRWYDAMFEDTASKGSSEDPEDGYEDDSY